MRNFLVILILLLALSLQGQELPDLSNYQHNWMIYNPAFTGSREALSGSVFLRQKSLTGPGPMYQQLSLHTPMGNEKVAMGATYFNEMNPGTLFGQGSSPAPFTKQSIFLNYAYRIWTGGGRLSLGISAGVTIFGESFDNLTLTDPVDEAFISGENEFLPNFGAGVLYYTDEYFVGLSIPYFLSRGEARNSIQHDFQTYNGVLTGGYKFKISDGFTFNPTALLLYDVDMKSINYQGSLNVALANEKLWLGIIYKSSKAISFNTNIEISRQLMLGYSYDYYFNQVNSYFSGSHEIVLRYELRKTVASNVPFYY